MYYRDLFRNKEDVKRLAELIKSLKVKAVNIMEVCGTHTMAIASAGIKQLLPPGIKLISGPGCPVCVTPAERIDDIYRLSKIKNTIIATYGDMIKVPGTKKNISLERSRMEGGDVRIVYSSMDALQIAAENPQKEVVFLGIGFETTAPASAAAVKEASRRGIGNFSVFTLHKTVEPVIRSLLDSREVEIHGFLLPGHVAAIIGINGFKFIEDDYGVPGVISGFEPSDILKAIYMILRQIEQGCGKVENEYIRMVNTNGNEAALNIIREVFEPCDDIWRGLGIVKSSGLKIVDKYEQYDAVKKMGIRYTDYVKDNGCMCGEILMGKNEPMDCPLFGTSCTPDSPVGPCMVSSEGSCAAAYKYM